MKRLFTYLIILIAAAATAFAAGKDDGLLRFETTEYDFGKIDDTHEPITYLYKFTNVSDQPVAVLSVSTGCGCTRPEYPLKPVAPGKSAEIKITFLPKGQGGWINKDIKVRYRAAKAKLSKRTTLRLKGNVTRTAK